MGELVKIMFFIVKLFTTRRGFYVLRTILMFGCGFLAFKASGDNIFAGAVGFIAPFALWHGVAWAAKNWFGIPAFWGIAKAQKEKFSESKIVGKPAGAGLKIYVGKATGELKERGHGTGASKGNAIWLNEKDAAKNIVVFGGIGSGKTVTVIQRVLDQLLNQHCGALIFDVKGDFTRTAEKLAERNGKTIQVIGPGRGTLNLLAGLTPETAAEFLKSAFILFAGGSEKFWTQAGTMLCLNGLGVLSFVPGHFNLSALHRLLHRPEEKAEILDTARRHLQTERDRRLFENYSYNLDHVLDKYDEKLRMGIIGTVDTVLSGLTHPDMEDFCCQDTAAAANMDSVLDGGVFCLSLPLVQYGAVAKIIYTIIKLRFYTALKNRVSYPDRYGTSRAVFCCDEFQQIISANKDSMSDLDAFDTLRSAGLIGLVSAQHVSSFITALGGDKPTAATILANFRQKICLQTEDLETIEYFQKLAGQAEVWREGTSTNSGWTAGESYTDQDSKGKSRSQQMRNVVDGQMFRGLNQGLALAFLSTNGRAVDDIIKVDALLLD